MTRREIAKLACQILALWWFSQGVITAAGILLWAGFTAIGAAFGARGFDWVQLTGSLVMAVPALGYLIAGWFFWTRATRIAGRMMPDDATPVTRPDMTQADVMIVAFTAIGVFTLVPVLRELGSDLYYLASGFS